MLSLLLEELRSTSKPSQKQEILLKHDSWILRNIIRYTYDPFVMYNVKIKPSELPQPGESTIESRISDIHDALELCVRAKSPKQNREIITPILADLDSGSQALLLGILNKNWKVGLGVKTILKVFPDIVPVFSVQLAGTYEGHLKKKGHVEQAWYCTPKLDGVRCIALREQEDKDVTWRFYSRKGHQFLTVDHISAQLEEVYKRTGLTFWDGELYKHGLGFEEIQSLVTGFTKGTAYDIEYHTFVGGKSENFLSQDASGIVLADPEMMAGLDTVEAVTCKLIEEEQVYKELETTSELGYEGIMLRSPHKLYDFKRSDALLKLKNAQEESSDCYVVDLVIKDDFPVVIDWEIKYKRYISNLIVEQQDGTLCRVGSGFCLEQRELYTNNPELILHQIVEIEHQGYGKRGRMRFPRFKRVRSDLVWGE